MILQWDNTALSSFILWLDHEILSRGYAYNNIDSKLYPANNRFNGYYQYNFPYSQLVNDFSVPGNPQIPTGLYLNSVFVPVGTSGLASIDLSKGQAYFSTGLASNITVSGRYAVKDINVSFANFPDLSILFETKLPIRSKTNQDPNNYVGIANNELAYPVIFCRQVGSESKPACFGGTKEITNHIECLVLSDSLFNFDATMSIMRDLKHEFLAVIAPSEQPFNNLGGFKNNIPYNYTGVANLQTKLNFSSGIFVKEVFTTDFNKRGLLQEIQNLSNDVYFGVVEFQLTKDRLT